MTAAERVRALLHRGEIADALARDAGPDVAAHLEEALDAEISLQPPRIAVVGETGVGKSSTINALFARGLPVSHTRACTHADEEIVVETGLRVVDLPGLGEDLASDKRHLAIYARVLPTADVVLWILKADSRAMTHVQSSLKRLVRTKVLDRRKLVIAINQVDLVQPGKWDDAICQPSIEQEQSISDRREDVIAKVRQAIRFPDHQIVAYSALRRYNLELLLEALLIACDEQRRWVLESRARCADFNELVEHPEPQERP